MCRTPTTDPTIQGAGHKVPKNLDAGHQQLLELTAAAEAFAINLAILKSPHAGRILAGGSGAYALDSEQYCHLTSPIRRATRT